MPCLHHNGKITGYRVVARTIGESERDVNVNDGNARAVHVSGLSSSTLYTVLVAAVNNGGTGPASEIDVTTCKYVVERLHTNSMDIFDCNSRYKCALVCIIIMDYYISIIIEDFTLSSSLTSNWS